MRGMQKLVLAIGITLSPFAVGRAAEADAYLPNDSEVVLSCNVQQLLNSPLGKKYFRGALEQALKDNPQAVDILKLVDFDPTKDVSRATLAMWGKDNVLVIVTGKFQREKIGMLAAKAAADQPDKLKIHPSDAGTIYEMVGDDKKSTFAAFASEATILMSADKATVKDALAKSTSKYGQLKKELAGLIAKADAKQTLWLAALPSAASALPLPGDNPQQKQAVDSLEAITGTLNIDSNARLTISVASKNAQTAQLINKQVIDLVNLAKLFLPNAAKDKPEIEPLVEVVNSIRTLSKGKTVVITAEMSAAQIQKAVNSVQKNK